MMANDWKASFPFAERYDNIQKIQSSRGLSLDEAMSTERQAYEESASKDEYLSKCQSPIKGTTTTSSSPPFTPSIDDSPGITIGPFQDCAPIADGITSEVYRSASRALKVIVTGNRSVEPHNPHREVKILESLRGADHPNIVDLISTFRDQEARLVLEFEYMPLTLADVFGKEERLDAGVMRSIFKDVVNGLRDLHSQGIIHRDIKPSAILLSSPKGPVYISDFGTAWHPQYSSSTEPLDDKILDIGTGPYRPPDCLFGNKSYNSAIDMWSLGVMLSEAITFPSKPIFESRPAHEDGSQLGLILSIFKTLGTPTKETWPEAEGFKVTPFELWTVFPRREWEEILPNVDAEWRELVAGCLRYDGKRVTAEQALQYPCF